MNTELQQAKAILETSGLFSAINDWKGKALRPYFRAREMNLIFDAEEALRLVDKISEKIAPMKVGDLCSILGYSDVSAARVIHASKDGLRVVVQEDKATLLNGVDSGEADALTFDAGGFCGHTSGKQRWKLEADPEGRKHEFSIRVNGEWYRKGESMNSPAVRFSKSHYHYHDFNF